MVAQVPESGKDEAEATRGVTRLEPRVMFQDISRTWAR
jgi:hypothetical protein